MVILNNVNLHFILESDDCYDYFVEFFPNDTEDRFKIHGWISNHSSCEEDVKEFTLRLTLNGTIDYFKNKGFNEFEIIENLRKLLLNVIIQSNREIEKI